MRDILKLFLLGLWVLGVIACSCRGAEEIRFVNQMQYVLGDVKQGFIHDHLKSEAQVENLLLGFKAMRVNGIRVPIFAEGVAPDPETLDTFIRRAKEEGFKIFANPVLTSGGARLAMGILQGETSGTLGNEAMTQALIDRILSFANEYECDWICPFNEDGSPGKEWSVAQYEQIFFALHNNLNGAELIGPCHWGLKAGNDTFEQTGVMSYVAVATTHNLGFDHELWPQFIAYAEELELPVWDSEVNNNAKNGRIARIESALRNKVDGLVLYDSWKGIDLETGALMNSNLYLREYYIESIRLLDGGPRIEFTDGKVSLAWKDASMALQGAPTVSGPWSDIPDAVSPFVHAAEGDTAFYRLALQKASRPADQTLALLHAGSGRFLSYDPENGFALDAAATEATLWNKRAVDNQWFYLEHVASGMRLGSDDGTSITLASESDQSAYHWLNYADTNGSDWIRLIQRDTEKRLHIKADGSGLQLGPSSWTGNNTQWQLVLIP